MVSLDPLGEAGFGEGPASFDALGKGMVSLDPLGEAGFGEGPASFDALGEGTVSLDPLGEGTVSCFELLSEGTVSFDGLGEGGADFLLAGFFFSLAFAMNFGAAMSAGIPLKRFDTLGPSDSVPDALKACPKSIGARSMIGTSTFSSFPGISSSSEWRFSDTVPIRSSCSCLVARFECRISSANLSANSARSICFTTGLCFFCFSLLGACSGACPPLSSSKATL